MHIGVLALDFHLAGCRSLKEKRRRVGRLRDKFGRIANLAVCESAYQDSHSARAGRWSRWRRCQGRSGGVDEVERWVAESVDATIVDVDREVIAS